MPAWKIGVVSCLSVNKRHCCTEWVSWEHAACPLSGINKRPLVGGWLNISSVVISSGATASVCYREVVCSGPLWEVPLYTSNSFHFFRMWLYLLFQWLWKSYCTKHLFPMRRIYHWHSNAWVFIRNFPEPQQNLGSTCGDTILQEVPFSFRFCSSLWHSKSTVNSIEDSSLSLDKKHQEWVEKVRGLVSEHLTDMAALAMNMKCTNTHHSRTSLKAFLSQKTLDGKLKTADIQ